jgi:hypothetical protein
LKKAENSCRFGLSWIERSTVICKVAAQSVKALLFLKKLNSGPDLSEIFFEKKGELNKSFFSSIIIKDKRKNMKRGS